MAGVARRRPGRPPAFRVAPSVELPQQLLLVHPGSRLGAGFSEHHRVRPLLGMAVSQWQRMGQAPGHPARDSVHAVRQRVRWLRGPCGAGGDLRQPVRRRRPAFFDRWQAALPWPLTAEDRARGYHHERAFRQAEISDTRRFDRPAAGRAWFERPRPDQLTLGRPDQVAIGFGRRVSRQTPGRFHTKIFNPGVEPAIQVHYRAWKVKQYFKEGRALRTETTVNDTRDLSIGRASPRPTGLRSSQSVTRSTSASSTINSRRASARQTPRPSNPWCCHPSKMA